MSDKNDEVVLCVSRGRFDDLLPFQGFAVRGQAYLDQLVHPAYALGIPRYLAEGNEKFKQIIPCAVFFDEAEQKIYYYRRTNASGEERLHGSLDICVNGHIKAELGYNGTAADLSNKYYSSLYREIDEEVITSVHKNTTGKLIGFVNDDSVAVGRVHFGGVHLFYTGGRGVTRNTADHDNDGFISIEDFDLRRDEFNSWSRLIYDGYFNPATKVVA